MYLIIELMLHFVNTKKILLLDSIDICMYTGVNPPGLILYIGRQLISSSFDWGFFFVPIKSRHHYLRMILNQPKINKNLASVYIEVWVGGGVPYVPLSYTLLIYIFDKNIL